MKKTGLRIYLCLLVISSLFISFSSIAQQDQLYFTYPMLPLNVNPAYAGSREVVSVAALYRRRPLFSTVGAASTNQQYFNFDMPIAQDKMAIGFQAYNAEQLIGTNTGGIIGNLGLYGDFAYRFMLPNDGKLALGVQAGVTQVPAYISSTGGGFGSTGFKSSIGLGVYYHNDDYYAGLSMMNLNADKTQFSQPTFLTAGYVFHFDDQVQLKTGVLVRRLSNAYITQTDVDFNATAWFNNRFGLGLWYQNTGSEFSEKAILGSLQIQFSKIQLGYAYDFEGNPDGAVGAKEGFHQIMLRYEFDSGNGKSGVFRFF